MSWNDFINIASSIVQVIWGPSAAIAFWWGWKKDRNKVNEERAVNNALLRQEVKAITDRMNKEFGGNSGGVRERINAMSAKIDHIEEKIDETAIGLAKLTGRFDEHTD